MFDIWPIVGLADFEQPRRFAQRQRLQHDGVHGAEDRRRAADAERERQDREGREAAVLEQLARGEDEVLPELGEVTSSFHVVIPPLVS